MRNLLFPVFLILLFQWHVMVSGQITATIIGDATEVCLGDSVAAYLNFSGGEGPWDVVINDRDGEYIALPALPSSHTIWLSPDTANTYYIASVEDSNGTAGNPLGEASITVHKATPVTIEMDRTVFLQSESGIALVSSPSGGSFSGAGVAGSLFYPGIATAEGSPHTIHCILTNEFTCISTDVIDLHVLSGVASVALVSGNDTINVVCDDGATYYLRGSNEDLIPGTFELVDAGSMVPIPSHITDSDLFDDEAVLDPVGLSGAYDIVYSYGLEEVSVSATFRFHVNDLGSLEISNFPDTVCMNEDPFLLVPELYNNDPGATYSFSGPGVSGSQEVGYYYDPASPDISVGENHINLDYTSSNGCNAKTIQTVRNSFVPTVDFLLSSACLPVDGGTVSFTNITSGKFSVASWSWDFGNPGSGSENYSNLEHPDHFYLDPGTRRVSLTATTHEGCMALHSIEIVLADQPVADFTWLSDCFIRGERTSVMSRSISTFSQIDTLIWTFKTENGGVLGLIGSGEPTDTIDFPFTSMDNYSIELHVENEVGCSGDVTKEIILKPTMKLAAAGYYENFNDPEGDWIVDSPDMLESWVLDLPDFSSFEQVPGNLAWYTSLPGHTEGYLEQSWVQSPCFDFTGITQPIVQLDIMKSFVPGTDGAVLQYQDLVSEGWKTIGNVGEGLNWFNEWGIFNEPGGSSFGWGLSLFEPDHAWVKAAHALDMLAGHSHVKFRVAIATWGTLEIESGRFNQGFAFDNFFIGERHRCSILEYFTNAASETAKAADEVVDVFSVENSNHVVDLQYHMDYPGEDAMNENNPYPSSTRSFYYGVPGVPHAVLNGGVYPENRYDFSDSSHEPGLEELEEASLEIPVFNVALQVDYLENNLEATVIVTCAADTFASNLQLYLVVMEREVTAYTGLNQDTSFRNVVLDMLPSPAGKLLGNQWNLGKSETLTYSWDYAEYVEDVEDLSVVAFVQDRDNGNVLQADAKPHTPGVGIKNRVWDPGALAVYPNPAIDYLFVNFGHDPREDGQLKIVDISGRVVMQSEVPTGYSIQRLDISHLSKGMYMIYWMESGEVKARNKVIVTH